jgi:hypothetical protein
VRSLVSSGARARRVLSMLGTLTILGLCVSACSPVSEGGMALARNSSGGLVAIVVTCDAEFDGVVLRARPQGSAESLEEIGTWHVEGGFRGASEVDLVSADPAGDWKAIRPWDGLLDATYQYEIRAGKLDGSGLDFGSPVSHMFAFSSSDLVGLEAGEMFHRDFSNDSTQRVTTRMSVKAFEKSVCSPA